MKIIKLFFLFIAIIYSNGYYSQVNAPKYSNEFLNLGVGAKAFGMSNSIVALTSDVTSGYWNPAGLASMKDDMQVEVMHAEYFAGIANYDYLGFAKRIDSSQVFALSMLRFGVDNILNTTELIDNNGNVDYDRIKLFSAADYAFLISYARKSKIEGLNLGANAKIIHRRLGDFASAWGFGFDISAQYDYKKWKFAAVGKDITTTFNAWNYNLDENTIEVFENTGNEIPENSVEVTLPKLVVGAARVFKIKDRVVLSTELDLDVFFDGERNAIVSGDFGSVDPHFGFDIGYENTVFLRGGVGNFQYTQDILGTKLMTFQPNIGIGLRIRNFYLDYSLSDVSDQSIAINSNIFSLRINI